jgi:hypothetical protein
MWYDDKPSARATWLAGFMLLLVLGAVVLLTT